MARLGSTISPTKTTLLPLHSMVIKSKYAFFYVIGNLIEIVQIYNPMFFFVLRHVLFEINCSVSKNSQ
jgi:hypothetical protein